MTHLSQTYIKGPNAAMHRIDLPLEHTGFQLPPCQVQLKFLPMMSGEWTVLVNARSGATPALAQWLGSHPGIEDVAVAPGLAPKLVRAVVTGLPPAWTTVAAFTKVHHLDLGPDGNAAWFVEATAKSLLNLVRRLEAAPPRPGLGDVRCRPVRQRGAAISRRQHEALAMAVALGYYEIPHRIDLRTLAERAGFSLGSVSELLRRAEAAILCSYVDSCQLDAPALDPDLAWGGLANLTRPGTTARQQRPAPSSWRDPHARRLEVAPPGRPEEDALRARRTD